MSLLGAVLDGGPFDGDDGFVNEPLPDSVWAFHCPHGGTAGSCEFGGVHWARERAGAPTCGAQEYVYSHVDQADIHHYRFGDMPTGLLASHEVREPVTA